ncbi:MAG: cyclase [Flavobacteriales bacterium]|jgi:cyclase
MKLQSYISAVVAVSLVLSLSLSFVQAEDHHAKSASFTKTRITDSISMLQGRGGNIAVFNGEQGLVLVDNGYSYMSELLEAELKSFGGADAIRYIINTHWHGDHTQGNLHFGHHAPIVAHENVRRRLLTQQEIKLFKAVSEPYPEHALPSISYDKKLQLNINDEDIQLIHLPGGHTDGDSIVMFTKANVIHLGDHLFNGFYPFVDVDNGGNVLTMAKNLEGLLGAINDKTILIPGHGPLANKADVLRFIAMLKGTNTEVQALKDKGLNLNEIQKKGLSAQWDSWGNGFLNENTWIGIVYSSLK